MNLKFLLILIGISSHNIDGQFFYFRVFSLVCELISCHLQLLIHVPLYVFGMSFFAKKDCNILVVLHFREHGKYNCSYDSFLRIDFIKFLYQKGANYLCDY